MRRACVVVYTGIQFARGFCCARRTGWVGFSMSDIPQDHRKPSLCIKPFALQAPCVSIDSATHSKVNRIPDLFVDQLIHGNSVGGLSKRGCIFL